MDSDVAESALGWGKEQLFRAERWVGRQIFADPFLKGEKKMLFVLGHMRTGSSLLVHILTSNPGIVGYGETHSVYTQPQDFGAVTAHICRRLRRVPGNEAYMLDKVLHKYQVARDEVLLHPSVRLVFMIRRPVMALSSIVRQVGHTFSPERAREHYIGQIKWMQATAQRLDPTRWTFVTYQDLVEETAQVFERLERFLGVDEPMTETYRTTRFTGVRGVGDAGTHIESGRIKRNIDRTVDRRIRPFLREARWAFTACYETLHTQNIW